MTIPTIIEFYNPINFKNTKSNCDDLFLIKANKIKIGYFIERANGTLFLITKITKNKNMLTFQNENFAFNSDLGSWKYHKIENIPIDSYFICYKRIYPKNI